MNRLRKSLSFMTVAILLTGMIFCDNGPGCLRRLPPCRHGRPGGTARPIPIVIANIGGSEDHKSELDLISAGPRSAARPTAGRAEARRRPLAA